MSYGGSKTYYEAFAKYLLEGELDFKNIFLSDMPDLISDTGTGIEVTRLMDKNEGEANAYFDKVCGMSFADVDEAKIGKLNRLGYELLVFDGKICGLCPLEITVFSSEYLFDVFRAKLKKLKKYQICKSTSLFVVSFTFRIDLNHDSRIIVDFLTKADALQKNSNQKFSIIYILDYDGLLICDLAEKTLQKLHITQEKMLIYSQLASEYIKNQIQR